MDRQLIPVFLNLLDGKDMGGGRILKVRFAESQAVIKVQALFTTRESSTLKLVAGDGIRWSYCTEYAGVTGMRAGVGEGGFRAW
jgi:hypothetical protein